jgi:hypothetical protein
VVVGTTVVVVVDVDVVEVVDVVVVVVVDVDVVGPDEGGDEDGGRAVVSTT